MQPNSTVSKTVVATIILFIFACLAGTPQPLQAQAVLHLYNRCSRRSNSS
jgi:hypothetical protein